MIPYASVPGPIGQLFLDFWTTRHCALGQEENTQWDGQKAGLLTRPNPVAPRRTWSAGKSTILRLPLVSRLTFHGSWEWIEVWSRRSGMNARSSPLEVSPRRGSLRSGATIWGRLSMLRCDTRPRAGCGKTACPVR